eukprot:13747795-Alexandrium_andersonii.AAC.1
MPEEISHCSISWLLALQQSRIARIAGRRIVDWSPLPRDFAPSDPFTPRSRWQIRNLHEQRCRTHPWRASGTDFEVVPGPAQFQ